MPATAKKPLKPLYGVYTAQVIDFVDPDGVGRVKVRFPWLPAAGGGVVESWARLAALGAGYDRGVWWLPEVGDEVLVSFIAGDMTRPVVVGSLWNSAAPPPVSMDAAGENNIKTLRTRSGLQVTLDDSDGQEKLELSTPEGQKLTLSDGRHGMEMSDSSGNRITLEGGRITLSSAGRVVVNASLIEVSAGAVMANTGLARFTGVVQCDTLITNSVISASYTPGAGNIW